MHIIEQFNSGNYDTIIASDEKSVEMNETEAEKKQGQTKKLDF